MLALESSNAAASNGAKIRLLFLFYPPSCKILSGRILEAEVQSMRGRVTATRGGKDQAFMWGLCGNGLKAQR